MNYLYKIKRTLERRNHTRKTKLDASDYHTRLLLTLRLRSYCWYARKIATWVRRSKWRLKSVQDIGMKPQAWSAGSLRQEKKVALLCSLACASEANYKIRYLLTNMHRLTNLCTLSANSSGMRSLSSCPSPLASLVAFEYVVDACGAATYR